MKYLSPSVLNSDFTRLHDTITMLNESEAEWIHLDIMDGMFVPNITFGPPIVATIKTVAKKPLDVHLMIAQPERYVDDFVNAGADILVVHYEACVHLNRTINYIKSKGIKAGVAINPSTPVSNIEEIIGDVDLVLNMTVNPGFGGQKFIAQAYNKLARLKEMIDKYKSKAIIQIDGGVDITNINSLSKVGVDSFVVGSFIFKSTDPKKTISELRKSW